MSGGLTNSPDDVYILQIRKEKRVFSEILPWGKGRNGVREREGEEFKKHHSLAVSYPYILRPAMRSKKQEVYFVIIIIIFNLAWANDIQTTSLAMVILSSISNLRESQECWHKAKSWESGGRGCGPGRREAGGVWEWRRETADFSHLDAS